MSGAAGPLTRPLRARPFPPPSRTGRALRMRGGRRQTVDPLATYEALNALRAADDSSAPRLTWAWEAVMRALHALSRQSRIATAADREDARQEAFLKVQRAVRDLKAETPPAAVAWLRTIYDRVLYDLFRARQRRGEILEPLARGDDRPSRLEQTPAPRQEDARIHDLSALQTFEEALLDAVEDYVARTVKVQHREQALLKAHLAYRKVVKREPTEALQREAGDVSLQTLYQWTRRGRAQVLLPAVLAWLEALRPDTDAHDFASELATILRGADRADAGQERPARRKKNDEPPVSPGDHCKSAQCDEDPDDEDDDG